MTLEQRRKNIQSILDKAKVIMADDRKKLIEQGRIEESFELLDRQLQCERMVLKKMEEMA